MYIHRAPQRPAQSLSRPVYEMISSEHHASGGDNSSIGGSSKNRRDVYELFEKPQHKYHAHKLTRIHPTSANVSTSTTNQSSSGLRPHNLSRLAKGMCEALPRNANASANYYHNHPDRGSELPKVSFC